MERNNVRLSGNVQNVGNNTRFEKIALSNEDMEYIGLVVPFRSFSSVFSLLSVSLLPSLFPGSVILRGNRRSVNSSFHRAFRPQRGPGPLQLRGIRSGLVRASSQTIKMKFLNGRNHLKIFSNRKTILKCNFKWFLNGFLMFFKNGLQKFKW